MCQHSSLASVDRRRVRVGIRYYGDIHAGTIAIRTGNPHDEDPWEWHCGFYPGSNPGEQQGGTAATFDEARADFECA